MDRQSVIEALVSIRVPEGTAERFLDYHIDRPEVWREFERFTLRAIESGRVVGAKAIGERVRWESEIERGEDFKISNTWIPYYARIFALKHPEHADYFTFKQIRGVREQ